MIKKTIYILCAMSMLIGVGYLSKDLTSLNSPRIAKADSEYEKYEDMAEEIWERATSQAMALAGMSAGTQVGGGGGASGAFGGQVVFALPCICSGSFAIYLKPVSGTAGWYNVPIYTLKRNYSVFPGRFQHVLGNSQQGGTCSIYLVIACYEFNTQRQVVNITTGIGSSLLP